MSSTSLTVHVFAPAVVLVNDVVNPSLLFARVIFTRRSTVDMSPVSECLLCMQPMIPNKKRDGVDFGAVHGEILTHPQVSNGFHQVTGCHVSIVTTCHI